MNIKWVSFDGFQSADSIQILRQKGFVCGIRSMDRDTRAYEITKAALYDGRVRIPEHPKLLKELLSLEQDVKKCKIDHNVRGSKDISDALAGVVHGLTTRREIWFSHGISSRAIPSSITTIANQEVDED